MSWIYTRNGRPLRRDRDDLFSRSGKHIARVKGKKAFGPDGRYVGTLVRDRLIYRSTDSATIWTVFMPRVGSPFATANRAGVADWGEEPPIAD